MKICKYYAMILKPFDKDLIAKILLKLKSKIESYIYASNLQKTGLLFSINVFVYPFNMLFVIFIDFFIATSFIITLNSSLNSDTTSTKIYSSDRKNAFYFFSATLSNKRNDKHLRCYMKCKIKK